MGIADFVKNKVQFLPNWITLPLAHLNQFKGLVYGPSMLRFRKSIPSIDPERRLLDMANYAIEHVPYYRKRYPGLRINSLSEFEEKIKIIDKKEVRDHFEEFISDEADSLPHVLKRTSGTSGMPLEMYHQSGRYVMEMAFCTACWRRGGWNYGIRATFRRVEIPEGRDYMVNPFTREFFFSPERTDEAYLRKVYRIIRRNGIRTLYGYSSAVFQTLLSFRNLGLDTSFIRNGIMVSEPVLPSYFRLIEDELGIKIISFYGLTEKLIFLEMLDQDTFAVEEAYGYTEVIGDGGTPVTGKGESGELVGSTLYNKVFPLLRYRTGDYVTLKGESVNLDGRNLRGISKIEGRRDRAVVFRNDGSMLTTSMLEFHDEHRMPYEAIQYVQHRKGFLEVNIIRIKDYDAADEEFLMSHLGRLMGGREFVKINYVERLHTEPNGKVLAVVNDLLK